MLVKYTLVSQITCVTRRFYLQTSGLPITGSFPVQYRKNPNFFRNPNNNFPYINLYLRTILELLVTSGISSGTPNNIR